MKRTMNLTTKKRAKACKKEAKRIRREGNIPAVLYSSQNPSENIVIKGREFQEVLRKIEKGSLSTMTFKLIDEAGNERSAIVKDIQYHITTYDILHMDFVELIDDIPVNISVPIRCVNAAECVGVKLGGVLRLVIRSCKVRCLPSNIPQKFIFDVKDLGLKQSLRLRELDMPGAVHPTSNMNEVAVIIAKR